MESITYIKDFLTTNEESELIDYINTMEWNEDISRKTQHYGYKYSYNIKNTLEKAKPIPIIFNNIIDKLNEMFNIIFDQLIVNHYLPGQGISAHIDNTKLFDNTIVSISMSSDCVMKFSNKDNVIDHILERRSLVALQGDARYKWKHSIPARKSDNNKLRETRISMTFRKVI